MWLDNSNRLYPIPYALSDQLHVLDGQMTYRPCCYIPISRLVLCHFFLLWFLFPPYCYCTVLHNSSCQLPNVPCHGLTGHKSLCHVVRDLLLFFCRWALRSISWLSFVFNLPVFTIYNKEVFPQSSDLANLFSLINSPSLTLLCILAMPHTIISPCIFCWNFGCWFDEQEAMLVAWHKQGLE